MKRNDANHLVASWLISSLVLSVGCDISFFAPGIRGSGVSKTESRTIGEFRKIEMAGSGELTIQCGQEAALEVTSDDNLLPYIETNVEGSTLTIRSRQRIDPTNTPTFSIQTQSLSNIELAGSGNVEVLDFAGETLKLEVAGSGRFKVVGTVEKVGLEVAGSGKADLSKLVASHVSIEIAGSGTATVQATDSLNVEVAGNGHVEYIGNPQVTQSIAGSATVQQIDAE